MRARMAWCYHGRQRLVPTAHMKWLGSTCWIGMVDPHLERRDLIPPVGVWTFCLDESESKILIIPSVEYVRRAAICRLVSECTASDRIMRIPLLNSNGIHGGKGTGKQFGWLQLSSTEGEEHSAVVICGSSAACGQAGSLLHSQH